MLSLLVLETRFTTAFSPQCGSNFTAMLLFPMHVNIHLRAPDDMVQDDTPTNTRIRGEGLLSTLDQAV